MKTTEQLEIEITHLTNELEQEREKSARLQNEIDAMRQQEANMAAHFRGR